MNTYKRKPEKLYLIWIPEIEPDDGGGYFEQFDTLEDALGDHDGEEVFVAEPRSIGHYRIETKAVKVTKKAKVK